MINLTKWFIRIIIVVSALIGVILFVNLKGTGENVLDRVFFIGLLLTLFNVASMVKASNFMGASIFPSGDGKGNVNLHQVTSACEANYTTSKTIENRSEYLGNGRFVFGKLKAYFLTIGILLIILSCLAYRFEFFYELLITESF